MSVSLPRPLVLLLFSVKDDRTNGVSSTPCFTNLDVSLKKQFIIHDIKYLAGILYVGASLKTQCEVLSLKRRRRKNALIAIIRD